jgi:FkbM family methyltransferase
MSVSSIQINNFIKLPKKYIKKRHIRNILLKIHKFFIVPDKYNETRFNYLGTIKIKTKNGSFKMKATGGSIENEIFWKGLYGSLEPETIWIIEKLSLNATCMIDIGANTGLYSLFVKSINPKCEIHAFEPSKKTFNELKQNILLNRFEIFLNNFAISDRNGSAIFYDTLENHQYSASLSPLMLKENPSYNFEIDEYVVDIMTLDSYVENLNINKIDLIKIDVELHEPAVFKGMCNTLTKYKPFILFEVLINEIGENLKQLLYGLDYEMFHFYRDKKTFKLVKVHELKGRINKDWNYFACHKLRIKELENHHLLNEL